MILVQVVVDRRYLTLAERVVERVVDLSRGEAKPRGRRAVDLELHFQPLVAAIGIDVFELRHVLQRIGDLRHPLFEVLERVGRDRVLIGAIALAPADAHILAALQEQPRARDAAKLGSQPLDDLRRWSCRRARPAA